MKNNQQWLLEEKLPLQKQLGIAHTEKLLLEMFGHSMSHFVNASSIPP